MSSSFANRLKTLRKKSGFTQEEFAELLGFSCMTVRRWENGSVIPRMNEIEKICEVLKCSDKELLNDSTSDDEWIVEVKFANSKKEVFDLAQGMPCISELLTSQYGVDLHIAGSYNIFQNDTKFKSLIAQLKKARELVLLNGKAIGGIKD